MLRDLRYAVRLLLRSPGFTLAAIGSLAFGIACNTTLFTVVNSIFLRPLPYERVNELVEIDNTRRATPINEFRKAQSFAGVGAFIARGFSVAGADGIRNVFGFRVTSNLFSMLGVQPALGRIFAEGEEEKPVAMLGYEYWRRISGDPAIVGSALKIGDDSFTIVGVLPPDFALFVRDGSIFIPYRVTEGRTLARLNPGVTSQQAEAEVASILAALPRETGPNRVRRAMVTPLTRAFRPNDGTTLLFLQVAVGLVLLITCVNVANLLLVRSSARRREFAIRAAIGAGRAQVARQLLIESALLASAGGGVGLLLAGWSVNLLGSLLPGNISRVLRGADALTIDHRVLLFTLAAIVLTALLCGFIPLRTALHFDVMKTLRDASRGSGGGRQRIGAVLVATEIALAVMLCVSAGLTLKSLAGLQNQYLGFTPDHVLRAAVDFSPVRYAQPQQRVAVFGELEKRLAALPGVEIVGLIAPQFFPFGGPAVRGALFEIQGRPAPEPAGDQRGEVYFAGADYFRSVRIPLISGRTFYESDTLTSLPVAVLSRTVAERHFGRENPVGRQIRVDLSRPDSPWLTVIGVVGDVRNPLAPREQPTIYRPFAQAPGSGAVLFIRTSGDPLSIANAVQRELRAVDPTAPEFRVASLEKSVFDYVSPQRFSASIFGFFAVLGLLLAGFGVYGVMRFWVTSRVPEIGVRLAIGAQRSDVLGLILGRAVRTALIGLLAGIAGAIALQRVMANLLYGVSPTDPMVLASVALVMAIAAVVAALGPAIWASRVDPMDALRHE
ncbi:MAG TPA: ABC transporter permease [Bryobacteraceae bacterium]|jgi:putative ABC transport system permease protein|nr:ABC transporter permease [Bryobacteraceae bacterium]